MKKFNFDIKKATQTAAYFLKLSGGKMNYTILLKMLYLSDRMSMDLYGKPIVGDMYCAMQHGPVLSTVLDYMTDPVDEKNKNYWSQNLKTINYDLTLQSDPSDDELSERDEEIIKKIYEKHKEDNWFQIVDYCHIYLPEWKKIYEGYGSPEITVQSIYKELGKTPEQIEFINDSSEISKFAHSIFQS